MDYYDEWFGLEYPLPKQGELQKKKRYSEKYQHFSIISSKR